MVKLQTKINNGKITSSVFVSQLRTTFPKSCPCHWKRIPFPWSRLIFSSKKRRKKEKKREPLVHLGKGRISFNCARVSAFSCPFFFCLSFAANELRRARQTKPEARGKGRGWTRLDRISFELLRLRLGYRDVSNAILWIFPNGNTFSSFEGKPFSMCFIVSSRARVVFFFGITDNSIRWEGKRN